MSLHVELSAEAQARLAAQRRNSTISSAIVALLVITVLALVLGIFLIPALDNTPPEIVTYQQVKTDDTQEEVKKVRPSIQKKPTPPASSTSKVITSMSTTAVSVPTPEEMTAVESVDFGDGDDFGSGWGDDSFGEEGGGGATFFNQKVAANRIAYVIDYSASMRGTRDELMRDELKDSISGLQAGTKYQMIFFAGPAWIAGDELEFDGKPSNGKGAKEMKITTRDGKTYKSTRKGNWPNSSNYKAKWLDANTNELKESRAHIRKTELVYGTEWGKPMEMAMDMSPAPQIIFFMTDGNGGATKVPEIIKTAKRKNIVVNTIAMMLPKGDGQEAMATLAEGTGGVFTIIDEKGKSTVYKGEK
ncbi:MAG: hypothetical protein ACSHX7_03985 [Luteolibacter sp.]